MAKVIIYLPEQENHALEWIAQREYRAPQAQAALIIRTELERQGLLPRSGGKQPKIQANPAS